jgi:SAM-dependent methyltransferase
LSINRDAAVARADDLRHCGVPVPTDEEQRRRRALFATDAANYDAGRPGYPTELFALLRDRGGLGPGCRVLEIGPGTGQATAGLLDAGATVTAVELGGHLADRLRAKLGHRDLEVRVGAFEDAEVEPGSFDLVAAATSFHWVPVDAGLRQAAGALRAGGSLALWWHVFGDHAHPDAFHRALVPILERLAPQLVEQPGVGAGPVAYGRDAAARTAEIDATGRFGPVHHEELRWTGRHGPTELRALFASFSPWLAVEPDLRSRLLDEVERLAVEEFGGIVERPYFTAVYLTSTQR